MTFLQQQALNLVQALLGMITPNFRRVSISTVEEAVTISIVLEQESLADREEIDDLMFEFEALQATNIETKIDVTLSTDALSRTAENSLIVYCRKES